MVRTADAVADFFATAKSRGADKVLVFGTEAMRNPGGETLKRMIESRIPVTVDIISGKKEAEIGYIGCTGGKGNNAVIDIGGASVELTSGENGDITYAESLKLGVVRTRDQVGDDRKNIENFYKAHVGEYKKVSADKLFAIGGTATSIASMLLGQKTYDAEKVHGYVVTQSALEGLIDRIFASESLTEEFPTIGAKRAGVIGHGAILLLILMQYLGFSRLTVSEHDNIEGYLIAEGIYSN
ncbi:MAG: hypothetical protein ACI4SC_04605, partial [Candidatus Neoclostridium sp.]